ncbi:MAG: FkbM family methyltransferase [Methanobacteriota archaeon]
MVGMKTHSEISKAWSKDLKKGFFRKDTTTYILRKLRYGPEVIRLYENWYSGLLDFFLYRISPKDKHIIYRLRDGTKYKVRRNKWDFFIVNETYVLKEYSDNAASLENASVVIDIGAHIGVFSVFIASKNPNAKVYSYEPFSENFELLKENITLNRLEGRILPFKLAVASERGKGKLFLNKENPGCHSINEKYNEPSNSIAVNCITLKDIFESNKIERCDFLKMDCEGVEYEILVSTPKEYLKKIRYMVVEVHQNVTNIQILKKFLEDNGFRIKLKRTHLYAQNRASC